MKWTLTVLFIVGIGVIILGRMLNQSYNSPVSYEGDPLLQVGKSWNPQEIREVQAKGKSLISVNQHVSHTIRMDETGTTDVVVPGTIGSGAKKNLDLERASILYPVEGTPWGVKGPCLVWRFPGVDLKGMQDFGGVEVHIADHRSREHTFYLSFLSRIATVPLAPGESMKYVIVPDMTIRPSNTRALDKRDSLEVIFPGVTERDDVDLISVNILSKHTGYQDAPVGNGYETLDHETRSTMYQWTDGAAVWDCVVSGDNPQLTFGVGLLPQTAPVTFSITVGNNGTDTEIFTKTVHTGDSWSDYSLDLSAWVNRRVRIMFKVLSQSPAVALWSSPRIVESRRRGKLFCIYVVDALRTDFCEGFSTFRGRENATPAISTLARQGAQFTNTLANAPITKYSVATLFTGLYPSHNGIMRYQRIPDDILTLAEVFRENGFMTASFLFNTNAGRMRGFHQGFDFLFSSERISREARSLMQEDPDTIYGENPSLTSGGMINDFLFDFLRTHQEEDVFLYLHLMDTHAPYFPDEEFLREFYNSMSQRGLAVPTDPFSLLNELKFTQRPSYSPKDHLSEEALLELYRGSAQTADKHLQRFTNFLSAEGRGGEATIVFTSDHGEHLNEHPDVRLFTHMHPMLLEVLKVPLIIQSPVLEPGKKIISKPAQLADVMPTMLDLAGITYNPTQFDGVSLLLLMAGEDHDFFNKRPIISQSSPFWSVLLGDIHCPDITRGYDIMVYNSTTDPREHTPLQGNSAQVGLERLVNSLSIIAQREIPGTETIFNDEETLEQLKQLGYIQ